MSSLFAVSPEPIETFAMETRLPLGEQLIAAGMLTEVQLDLARREQQRSGGRLAQILVQLDFVTPRSSGGFLARQAGTRTINLNRVSFDQKLLALVPLEVARRCLGIPVSRINGTLTVALADPFDVTAVDTLQQITGLAIEVVTAPQRDILNCLDLYYSTGDTIGESIDKILDAKEEETALSLEEVLGRMANKDEDAPVIRVVRQIITRAVNNRASDIHLRARRAHDASPHPDRRRSFPGRLDSESYAVGGHHANEILADLDLAERGCRRMAAPLSESGDVK